jgi:polysaccharide deacetylase 2 family uncharacterized protein YibQ
MSLGALLAGLLLASYIAYGVVIIERHVAGYLVTARHWAAHHRAPPRNHHRVSGRAAVALVSRAPLASPAPSAAKAPLPEEPHAPAPAALKPRAEGGPARLAIIIDDCGNNLVHERRFLQLPIPLTLSVLPMSAYGREIAAEAASAGKDVMLHLPMQPESPSENPGPGAISTNMSDDAIVAQVDADIASLPPLPGANNHMGSKATSDARVMRNVLGEIQRKHLFFIDSLTIGSSVGYSTARELGVPTAERDVFLDNSPTLAYVEGQLKAATAVALRNGTAIAIGHPNPATADALSALIPQIESAGITFVPAQSLVR